MTGLFAKTEALSRGAGLGRSNGMIENKKPRANPELDDKERCKEIDNSKEINRKDERLVGNS